MKEVINQELVNLDFDKSDRITLILETGKVNIKYNLKNGQYNILIFNNAKKPVELIENGNVINSEVYITYIDLNNDDFNQINNLLVYKDSTLNVHSIYLGIQTKDIKFNITNVESNSLVEITNNVVALDNADICLDVVGNIKKGAKNSKCHQSSRCLTFGQPKKAKVLPVLNIDENDVEASHSLSSGTIDEDVLFYMNSRGLTKKESLKLLLISYLMPNEEFYKEFDSIELKEIADKKVNDACSI